METAAQKPTDATQPPDQRQGFTGALSGAVPQDVSGGAAAAGSALPAAAPGAPAAAQPSVGERVFNFIKGGQSTGSFWRGIISGALTGMAAGAGQGHFGPGMAAGARAAQELAARKFQEQQQQKRELSESQYRAALTAHTLQETASNAWQLSRNAVKATEEDAQYQLAMTKEISTLPGVIDLGNTRDLQQHPEDLIALHKAYPDLPKNIAQGTVVGVPSVIPVLDANGKPTGESVFGGLHSYYVPPDAQNKLIDHDWNIPVFIPGKTPTEAGHYEQHTLEAGKYTVGKATQLLMDASKDAAKHNAEDAMARAEMAKARLAIEQSKILTPEQIEAASQLLAKDPINFDLKTMLNMRTEDRAKVMLRAEQLNPNFRPRQAEVALKTIENFTSGDVSQNLFQLNKGMRHLGSLGEAATALGNNDTVLLNSIAREVDAQIGKSNVATYNAIHAAVLGEVSKAYKGTGATDQEVSLLNDTLNKAQSPGQSFGAIQGTMQLLGEQMQDYYRQFRNGTYGHAPEDEGIQLVQPDVQRLMTHYKLSQIAAGGPPRKMSEQELNRKDAYGNPMPAWLPTGPDVVPGYSGGAVVGWQDKTGWHSAPTGK